MLFVVSCFSSVSRKTNAWTQKRLEEKLENIRSRLAFPVVVLSSMLVGLLFKEKHPPNKSTVKSHQTANIRQNNLQSSCWSFPQLVGPISTNQHPTQPQTASRFFDKNCLQMARDTGEGTQTNNWTTSQRKHQGINSLTLEEKYPQARSRVLFSSYGCVKLQCNAMQLWSIQNGKVCVCVIHFAQGSVCHDPQASPTQVSGLSPRVRPHKTMLLGAIGSHSSRIGVSGSLERMAVQHLMSASSHWNEWWRDCKIPKMRWAWCVH